MIYIKKSKYLPSCWCNFPPVYYTIIPGIVDRHNRQLDSIREKGTIHKGTCLVNGSFLLIAGPICIVQWSRPICIGDFVCKFSSKFLLSSIWYLSRKGSNYFSHTIPLNVCVIPKQNSCKSLLVPIRILQIIVTNKQGLLNRVIRKDARRFSLETVRGLEFWTTIWCFVGANLWIHLQLQVSTYILHRII
jgi:hypothetical protein